MVKKKTEKETSELEDAVEGAKMLYGAGKTSAKLFGQGLGMIKNRIMPTQPTESEKLQVELAALKTENATLEAQKTLTEQVAAARKKNHELRETSKKEKAERDQDNSAYAIA